jgi:hypothetical protein
MIFDPAHRSSPLPHRVVHEYRRTSPRRALGTRETAECQRSSRFPFGRFQFVSTTGYVSRALQTCRVIRELQFQRSLWLEALSRIRETGSQPLPLSTADPPDTLSLRELQNIARRADQLRRNLQSDNPRLFDMRSLSVVARAGLIFFIPGAHLAVTHGPGFVTCWDIVSSQMVGQLEIPHLLVRDEALSMDISGKALIGACITYVSRYVNCVSFR